MTDYLDGAQAVEQAFRDNAIARQLRREVEQPDEDDQGNRYCLSCGNEVPKARLIAWPTAVRCVFCQSLKDGK
ncbi:TraR/DksA family transcriptional regulator [Shewanella sp. NIFS-20-20]|uniref:TraR/DksA family transcriptional regulator n=1 Tax=Shewanella sp. NIFS-20-20 TaxID=2853806 RepID=UPI001C43DCAD|nr:TraR/DksA family transcriptional regulator [Shewanella sp. NIFS-20-20]MBV7315465.1 TraR/DksA family transcriptional regulator [Shewanella sp. NIFS-20-20]